MAVTLLDFLRAVVGSVLLAYAPGFAWVHVLVPRVQGLGKHVLSVGLSLALVTTTLWSLNAAFDVPITALSAVGVALTWALAGAGVTWFARGRPSSDASLRPLPKGGRPPEPPIK